MLYVVRPYVLVNCGAPRCALCIDMGLQFIDPEIIKTSTEASTSIKARPNLIGPTLLSVGLLATIAWDGLLVWAVGRVIGVW
jgi:hypothetical protein